MHTKKIQSVLCLLIAISLLLSGCSLMEMITHEQALSSYAESIFRRQNEVTSKLMMIPEDELDDPEAVYQAEMNMHKACRLLNEYSQREMEGKPVSLLFKKRVRNSLEDCDESIQELEELLEE